MKKPTKIKTPTHYCTETKLQQDDVVKLLDLRQRHATLQADAARIQRDEQDLSMYITRMYGNDGETIQIGPNGEITRTKKEAA